MKGLEHNLALALDIWKVWLNVKEMNVFVFFNVPKTLLIICIP